MSADDESFVPLTAQQLGLCGPRSDDTSVGLDAARHTPPADDQTARAIPRPSDEAIEAALDDIHDVDQDAHEVLTAALFWMSSELTSARSTWRRTMATATDAINQRDVLRARVAAVRALHRQVIDDSWPAPGHCAACWVIGGDDYVPWPCPTIAVLDGPTEAPAALCVCQPSGCDPVECSFCAAQNVYEECPCSVGPAEAAEPAPALIGTWADPEFRAHQDHKHAVDGCGYCPSEEDR